MDALNILASAGFLKVVAPNQRVVNFPFRPPHQEAAAHTDVTADPKGLLATTWSSSSWASTSSVSPRSSSAICNVLHTDGSFVSGFPGFGPQGVKPIGPVTLPHVTRRGGGGGTGENPSSFVAAVEGGTSRPVLPAAPPQLSCGCTHGYGFARVQGGRANQKRRKGAPEGGSDRGRECTSEDGPDPPQREAETATGSCSLNIIKGFEHPNPFGVLCLEEDAAAWGDRRLPLEPKEPPPTPPAGT